MLATYQRNEEGYESATRATTPAKCRQRRPCNAGGDTCATMGNNASATTAAMQQQQGCRQNNGVDAGATRAMTPTECQQRCQRNAAAMRVQQGQQCQRNNGNNGTMERTLAKGWYRPQQEEGVNATRTPAKMPARCWWRRQCNKGNNASSTTATMPVQQLQRHAKR